MKKTNAKPCPAQGRELPEIQTLHITGKIDDTCRQEWLDCGLPSHAASKLADASEAAHGLSAVTDLLIDDSFKREIATVCDNVEYIGLPPGTHYGLQCAQRALLRELNGLLEDIRSASQRDRQHKQNARAVSHEN